MSSNYEKKSAEDMRQIQKEAIAQAEAVQKTVAVMEPNWQAMIQSQKQQVETLAQILEGQMILASKSDIISLMQEQIDVLEQTQDSAIKSMKSYQFHVASAAKEAEKLMKKATEALEARSGQVSEKFSSAISEAQTHMRKWMLHCLLINAIPSLLLVILELVLR